MKANPFTSMIAATLLVSAVSWGQSSSVVSSARELAKQGLEAYDAGRYEEAADKLGKAYQVVRVPTLAVNQARALVKLGRWVGASELYLEATRIPRDKTWQSTQLDAQKDAEREREELLPRIPRLTVAIKGTAPTEVEVSSDGTSLPVALIGTEQLQDPGVHRVQGTRGPEIVTESITVREGDRANVTLQFKLVSAAVVQPGGSAPPARLTADSGQTEPPRSKAATAPDATAPGESRGASGLKTWGWVAVGTGGAGLLVGTIAGALALSKHSSLADSSDCSSSLGACSPSRKSDIDSLNAMRSVSTIGFIAGGVFAAAGVTLLLAAPEQEPGTRVGLFLSPNGANLTGEF